MMDINEELIKYFSNPPIHYSVSYQSTDNTSYFKSVSSVYSSLSSYFELVNAIAEWIKNCLFTPCLAIQPYSLDELDQPTLHFQDAQLPRYLN